MTHVGASVSGPAADCVFLILGLVPEWLTDSCHHVSKAQAALIKKGYICQNQFEEMITGEHIAGIK